MTGRRAGMIAATLAVLIAIVVLASVHHQHRQHPGALPAARRSTVGSSSTAIADRSTTTTPWAVLAASSADAGPSAVAPAARAFVRGYVAFLRHQLSATEIPRASTTLTATLQRGRSAAIPGTGATVIVALSTRRPAADGTLTAIAVVKVGGTRFGLEVELRQQHGVWRATSVPSSRGSF